MKTITLRLDKRLWKQMAKEKDYCGLNWEEYVQMLFGFHKEDRLMFVERESRRNAI